LQAQNNALPMRTIKSFFIDDRFRIDDYYE